jgi:hypothetical protein
MEQVKRVLYIVVGLALLMSVLAIFVHPAVDGLDAAQRHHRLAQLLIATVALVGGILLPPLLPDRLPALFASSRISAPEMLALFCVRLC